MSPEPGQVNSACLCCYKVDHSLARCELGFLCKLFVSSVSRIAESPLNSITQKAGKRRTKIFESWSALLHALAPRKLDDRTSMPYLWSKTEGSLQKSQSCPDFTELRLQTSFQACLAQNHALTVLAYNWPEVLAYNWLEMLVRAGL